MKGEKIIKLLVTKYLVLVILLTLVVILICWYLLFKNNYPVETINKTVDTIFKIMAIVVGLLWFLNRYFTERKDKPAFDITVDFGSIDAGPKIKLLIYRLDLFNKSNVLFSNYENFLEIHAFKVVDDKIASYSIERIPTSGYSPGYPIEPNSWTAINSELLIDQQFLAIRFYYEIKQEGKVMWSWHKNFKLQDIQESINTQHATS